MYSLTEMYESFEFLRVQDQEKKCKYYTIMVLNQEANILIKSCVSGVKKIQELKDEMYSIIIEKTNEYNTVYWIDEPVAKGVGIQRFE
jgi:hypothetical protein